MNYINNKYTKYYYSIILNAKGRDLSKNTYKEKHHIIPKAIGGDNNKDNLVKLTAREHFICHWLLTKMTEGNARSKMIYALNGMRRKNKGQNRYETPITSRVYARIKAEAAIISKKQNSKKLTEEHKQNISRGLTGIRKGVKFSDEHKQNLSIAKKGKPAHNKGIPMLEEQKIKLRVPKTEEHKQKLRVPRTEEQKIKLRVPKNKIKCPHCEQIVGGESNYYRWHHDNCKLK